MFIIGQPLPMRCPGRAIPASEVSGHENPQGRCRDHRWRNRRHGRLWRGAQAHREHRLDRRRAIWHHLRARRLHAVETAGCARRGAPPPAGSARVRYRQRCRQGGRRGADAARACRARSLCRLCHGYRCRIRPGPHRACLCTIRRCPSPASGRAGCGPGTGSGYRVHRGGAHRHCQRLAADDCRCPEAGGRSPDQQRRGVLLAGSAAIGRRVRRWCDWRRTSVTNT